jgi:hypothetical protein
MVDDIPEGTTFCKKDIDKMTLISNEGRHYYYYYSCT